MVQNRWNDAEAANFTAPIQQRVYSSRLLGADPSLVMHGGGNTSVKDQAVNILGEKEAVLYVKGSGWDLATIEASGFPAVRMDHLLRLRALEKMSDPEMMNELRTHLVNASSPDPSVEALLHAFIPHRFVDHTHADAVLTLTNQPNGEAIIKKLYGDRVAIVPYVMPGFQLAKLCAKIFEENPNCEGMVLLKHGIFSFGETAKQSYERMISLVNAAEDYIKKNGKPAKAVNVTPANPTTAAKVLAGLRTEYLARDFRPVFCVDSSNEARAFAAEGSTLSQRGPVTPDHVIRTKRLPLLLTSVDSLASALSEYDREYRAYFARNCEKKKEQKIILDSLPRIVLSPEVGVIACGASHKEARIALDIYQHTVQVIRQAEAVGTYEALPEDDIFDVEYWVLEQAKLKLGPKRLPLSGKIAVVTGGAGGVGLGITKEFLQQGAEVAVLDVNEENFNKEKAALLKLCKAGNTVSFVAADVAQRAKVKSAIEAVVGSRGGIDILVVNAGIFPPSSLIENISDESWDKTFQINVNGSFYTISEALPWMKKQKAGGDIVVIASKNVPAPGKEWATYSMSKAAQVQLARVCALEAAADGIRVNTLHPHLVFDTSLWTEEVLQKRAAAYGLTVEGYKKNNLLKAEISSHDVGRAALALVSGAFSKTTGAQIPVDGGSDRTL